MEKMRNFIKGNYIKPKKDYKDLKITDLFIVHELVTDHPQYGNCYKLYNVNTWKFEFYPVLFANERFNIYEH